MAKGGARKGAGRKPGGKNAKSAAIAHQAAAEGVTPLAYMLGILRDVTKPEPLRADMAKAAAPYMHPRLATHEVKGSGKDGAHIHRIEMVVVDHAD